MVKFSIFIALAGLSVTSTLAAKNVGCVNAVTRDLAASEQTHPKVGNNTGAYN
jgi:hypothetical protein